jgi:hypothetical protein
VSFLKKSSLALSLLAACAMPAFASVTVNTPTNGATVAPQFTLSADAPSCSNQTVSAMGFSLDSSSNTTIVNSATINATVTATTGAHTLHVKAWGNGGASCVTDVAITVGAASGTTNGVSVSTPGTNATVTSPFPLAADALTCSGQPVSAMGYSIDSGNTTIVNATAINTSVASATGAHTLHVKAWGNQGASCVSDVPLNVTTQNTSTTSTGSTSTASTGTTSNTSTTSPTTATSTPTTSNGLTVGAPSNGATVGTSFALSATATTCSSQPVGAMGYSIDSGNTTIFHSTSITSSVSSPTGTHTLHVKAWGNSGSVCVADVSINVSTQTTSTTPTPTPATTTAGIVVSSPVNNTTVGSPFTLNATATTCSSQGVSAMGYSLDSSSNTAIVNNTTVAASVTASTGPHTLHVKAWGNSGASCVTDVAINVGSGTTTPSTTSGGVSISSPSSGASVNSPFNLAASASLCSSQNVTSIGYAVDSASNTIASGTSLNMQISAAAGAHTLHVTAWGSGGASCTASVAVDVTAPTSPAQSVVPSNAISVSSIQALGTWVAQNDPATGGSSSGWMSLVNSPSLSGNARQFNTSFTNSSGEIYHITFGDDTSATNFFYDGWVYLTSSASNIANLELDMNQVTSNGQTIIYGFQCDGYSGTWDYTENAGTPSNPSDHWVHSNSSCNVRNWSQNAWHHIQVSYSRDNSGNVTYHSVWLDGTEDPIDATVPSAFALGWGPVLLTNFQVDGIGSGSNTVYLDKLTISRW